MMVDLPGAVGAEEAHDLAAGDVEADVVDGDEVAEPLDEALGDHLVEVAGAARIGEADHAAPPVSVSATNTSSMLGVPTAMSVKGTPARVEDVAELGNAQRRVVGHRMDAVADEKRMAHARRARDRGAHRAPGARGNCDQRAGHARFERGRRVAIERVAGIEQGEPVAALRLVEIGGGDHDGDALLPQPVENAPEIAPRHRIDAGGRLVEQQHLRRVHQRAGEAELLLHAAGQRAGLEATEIRHAGCRKQALGAVAPQRRRHFEQVCEELDVLVDGEILVEAEALRHVAYMGLCGFRVGDGVDPVDHDRAGIRPHHSGEHAQRRGLAGAVGPDQPENLAAVDREGEAVDRGDVGESFDETVDADELNRLGHGLPAGKAWSVASAGMPGTSSWVGFSMSILMR